MSKPSCPVCQKPYVSMETAKNTQRHPGARKQEWYKHDDNHWCTRTAPQERNH